MPESPQGNGTSGTTLVSGTNASTTGTLRHRKNRPAPQPPQQRPSSHNGSASAPEQLEIRAPSELLFGVPSTLKTQWRHQPKTLVTGCVNYVANVSVFMIFIYLLNDKLDNLFVNLFIGIIRGDRGKMGGWGNAGH